MSMKRLLLGVVAFAITPVAVFGQSPAPSPNPGGMSVDFSWVGTGACSARSPAFVVRGAPPGATVLDFQMMDLNVPSYRHGGGRVAFTGNGNIPQGAFSYVGPCPPGETHSYQWTVTALNASGAVLGTATAMRPFPPR